MTQKDYEDIPGTYVFDADRSREGYHLNMFCISLGKQPNREAFKADPEGYLDQYPMTPEQRQAVLDREVGGPTLQRVPSETIARAHVGSFAVVAPPVRIRPGACAVWDRSHDCGQGRRARQSPFGPAPPTTVRTKGGTHLPSSRPR